jgi:hypothetical protein
MGPFHVNILGSGTWSHTKSGTQGYYPNSDICFCPKPFYQKCCLDAKTTCLAQNVVPFHKSTAINILKLAGRWRFKCFVMCAVCKGSFDCTALKLWCVWSAEAALTTQPWSCDVCGLQRQLWLHSPEVVVCAVCRSSFDYTALKLWCVRSAKAALTAQP